MIAFCVARTIVLFNIALHYGVNRSKPYFRTYWTLEYVDELILMMVLYELAKHIFCPAGVWARDTRRAMQWLVATGVLLALGLSLLASPSSILWYQPVLLRTGLFTSVLMSELYVGTLVLASSAGLPWKTHVARITQGYGISSLISVVLQGINNYVGLGHGHHVYQLIANAENFSGLGFTGFWIVTLWRDAPAPRELPDAMLMQIYTLQKRVEGDLVRIRNWNRS